MVVYVPPNMDPLPTTQDVTTATNHPATPTITIPTAVAETRKLWHRLDIEAADEEQTIQMIFTLCTRNGIVTPGEPNRMGIEEFEKYAAICPFPTDQMTYIQDFWRFTHDFKDPTKDGISEDVFALIVKFCDATAEQSRKWHNS